MKQRTLRWAVVAVIALVAGVANCLSTVQTTARKRLKKSSFVQRRDLGTENQEILTREEIHNLLRKYSRRQYGSSNYRKGWRHFLHLSTNTIRRELSNNLPHPVNREEFENLAFRLGVAADTGEMPSFSDAGARSGYALDFFCRARNLADFLIDRDHPSFPAYWSEALHHSPLLQQNSSDYLPKFRLASIGGGPGYDFVAAVLVALFSSGTAEKCPGIQATILDYEEGWQDLVESMNTATQAALPDCKISCHWGGKCDITKSIHHEDNRGCLEECDSADMLTCQYCVAENGVRLQDTNFVFFRELFEVVPEGTLLLLTETTPYLWPKLYRVIQSYCPYMQVGFPTNRGHQMVLRKGNVASGDCCVLSDKDQELLDEFEKISLIREQKKEIGLRRQEKKVRGLVPSRLNV
jgi:hypothetical protein